MSVGSSNVHGVSIFVIDLFSLYVFLVEVLRQLPTFVFCSQIGRNLKKAVLKKE